MVSAQGNDSAGAGQRGVDVTAHVALACCRPFGLGSTAGPPGCQSQIGAQHKDESNSALGSGRIVSGTAKRNAPRVLHGAGNDSSLPNDTGQNYSAQHTALGR